jgi:hypothetical protein
MLPTLGGVVRVISVVHLHFIRSRRGKEIPGRNFRLRLQFGLVNSRGGSSRFLDSFVGVVCRFPLPSHLLAEFLKLLIYFATGGLPPISLSWHQAPWDPRTVIFFQLNLWGHVTSSPMRGWICRLQLLLVLARAVILGTVCRGAHGQHFVSQIRDSLNLEGQVPVFKFSWNMVTQLYPQPLGSLLLRGYSLSRKRVYRAVA